MVARSWAAQAALDRPKARLDRLALYPEPVRLDRVRIVVAPWFFRLPRLRRYRGYALWRTILLRRPPQPGASDDLLTHELCHIWQAQHRPLRMLLAYATTRYRDNPFEAEARRAVASTRASVARGNLPVPAGSLGAPLGEPPVPPSPLPWSASRTGRCAADRSGRAQARGYPPSRAPID